MGILRIPDRKRSGSRAASEIVVQCEEVVSVLAEVEVSERFDMSISKRDVAAPIVSTGRLFLRIPQRPSRRLVRRECHDLGKRGQFLILATPRPASSSDPRDGSDNRACPSPDARRSTPPSSSSPPASAPPKPPSLNPPLGRVLRSASCHRPSFNSSAMISGRNRSRS